MEVHWYPKMTWAPMYQLRKISFEEICIHIQLSDRARVWVSSVSSAIEKSIDWISRQRFGFLTLNYFIFKINIDMKLTLKRRLLLDKIYYTFNWVYTDGCGVREMRISTNDQSRFCSSHASIHEL